MRCGLKISSFQPQNSWFWEWLPLTTEMLKYFITIIISSSSSRSISIIITTFCASVDTWKMVWKGYCALPLFTPQTTNLMKLACLLSVVKCLPSDFTHADSIQTEIGLPDRRQMEKYLPANIPNFNKRHAEHRSRNKAWTQKTKKITGPDAIKSMWPPLRRHLTR